MFPDTDLIADFAVIQGVGFIRMNGTDSNTGAELKRLDAALSGRRGYVRLERLEPLSDTRLIESCRSDSARFASSGLCRKTLEIFRRNIPKANPTTETNLVVCLMYWTQRCLSGHGSPGELRKFIYTGKCGYKEYLFCYYASLMGFDVLVVPKEGAPDLPEGLLGLSRLVVPRENVPPPVPERTRSVNAQSPSPARISGRLDLERHTPRRKKQPAPVQQTAFTQPAGTARNIPGVSSDRVERRTAPVNNASAPRRELSFEELAGFARSVVMIVACDEKGETVSSGSGIMIGRQGYILTNFHVIRDNASFMVRVENDDSVYRTNRVIKYHPNFDLAIIKIERECEPLRLYEGKQELARGQKVCAIGSPLGFFNSVSDGIISGFRQVEDMQMIQFTAPISGGSSGGALLNLSGEVIGICAGTLRPGQNINLAVSYEQILPFVGGLYGF